MKDFVTYLFSENNSELAIGLFDVWHFLYLFVIFGGSVLLALLFKSKSDSSKQKLLRAMAYVVIGFYIADFFIMPLSDSYNGISYDKLPFHICTLTGVFVPFAQFNEKFKRIKTVVVSFAIASSLMWMCYPGSALGGQPPFSYVIFQTFMYHGVLFCWGFLNLALGVVELDIRKIWKELCAILVIMAWAAFGNAIYDNENWFFINESIFPFLTDEIMPPVVVFCVFGTCFVVYMAYYAIRAIIKKYSRKSLGREEDVPAADDNAPDGQEVVYSCINSK